jgi:hypothetical protein
VAGWQRSDDDHAVFNLQLSTFNFQPARLMQSRLKKALLLALAAALLAGVSQVQKSLNRDRDELGLTRVEPLENAPPVLAFTTVALGGFRGLIANALWIRASDLQDDDKFFEMAQLADWITKLEPHFAQVWAHQAWNMAYNISVKFKETAPGEFPDRWRWVQRGIELLRDEGLRYNPNDVLLYQQLGLLFQHKMGANLDDANIYYKQKWATEMAGVLGQGKPNFDELIQPQTEEAKARARLLRDKYKMQPEFMKEVDERYGPLEWRLPEAHAIYWAAVGLEKATNNPAKVNKDDLIKLRRVIYQSMQLDFFRGRLVSNPFGKEFDFGPNLEILGKANSAYERAIEEDEESRDNIKTAHRNFLSDAVYVLYEHDRIADASKWYQYLGTKYPEKHLFEGDTNSLPSRISLGEYAARRVQEDISEKSRDRVKSAIEGCVVRAYISLIQGEDADAAGLWRIANQIRDVYQNNIKGSETRIPMPPVEDVKKEMLSRLLDPERGLTLEARAMLRAKLGMGPESAPAPVSTNAPATGTNATPTSAPNK